MLLRNTGQPRGSLITLSPLNGLDNRLVRKEHNSGIGDDAGEMGAHARIQAAASFLLRDELEALEHAAVLGDCAQEFGLLAHAGAHDFVGVGEGGGDELCERRGGEVLEGSEVVWGLGLVGVVEELAAREFCAVAGDDARLDALVDCELEGGLDGAVVRGADALPEAEEALLAEYFCDGVRVAAVGARVGGGGAGLELDAALDEPDGVCEGV